jgi:hypothetical protein
MSRASALARGRLAAEAGMRDTCSIRRRTGITLDDASGQTTPTWTALYAGKCRIQQGIAQAAEEEVGEDYQLQLRLVLQLPIAVTGLKVGDEVTIVTSEDPDLAGQEFLIRDLMHKTDATARRVGIVERTAS